MISVFADWMFRPDSMIVVQTRTSARRSQKSSMTCSSWRSFIWPCAVTIRASGIRPRSCAAVFSIVPTRLCTKNTWPSRASSRRIAALTCALSYGPAKVRTGWRSSGGVAMTLISRMPVMAISSVRGMGVADMDSTSTLTRIAFSRSLCSTPKRCSSSMMTRPRSLNWTSLPKSRCVPMTTSILPLASPSTTLRASASVWNRDSCARCTGKPANRDANVW